MTNTRRMRDAAAALYARAGLVDEFLTLAREGPVPHPGVMLESVPSVAPSVVRVTCVGGTWSWNGTSKGQWYDPESDLMRRFARDGIVPIVNDRGEVFVWDSHVGGYQFWRPILGIAPDMRSWTSSGRQLYDRYHPPLAPGAALPSQHVHLVTHSHGIAPALCAAAEGLKINTLVDVCGPVRQDVIERYGKAARKNIGYWLSIYSDYSDWWQIWGAIGDGYLGPRRRSPLVVEGEGRYEFLPKVGHSAMLYDAAHPIWDKVVALLHERDRTPWPA